MKGLISGFFPDRWQVYGWR